MRLTLGVWLFLLTVTPASGQIIGAWSPESYVLKDGTELEVSGLIFFTEKDWTVLFFVKDGERRAGECAARIGRRWYLRVGRGPVEIHALLSFVRG